MGRAARTLWTIGHSTRSVEELVAALAAHGIELVADVRRFPGSRRLPQFQRASLEATLREAGIGYLWLAELGGRRRTPAAEPNESTGAMDGAWPVSGWRHAAFRAYAAHVASPEFASGLATLLDVAYGLRAAIMCAEILWWRCHRRLIADVLVATGHPVVHIRDAMRAEPHRLAPPAGLRGGVLDYGARGAASAAPGVLERGARAPV